MSAAELLDRLNKAGATLEIVDGRPRLQGRKIGDELKQELKANRAEVLGEVERRKAAGRHRYGQVPPLDAPMVGYDLRLDPQQKRQIILHVLRQPRPVHAWVMARAGRYFERGTQIDDCEWRACLDVIAWQRNAEVAAAAKFILDLPSNEELGFPECLS